MPKDKPHNVPLKDHLITCVVEELGYPEEAVSSIINWVLEDTQKVGMQTMASVEISGFGTFIMWPKKLKRKITVLERTIAANPPERKLNNAIQTLNSLRKYEDKGDSRGV